MATFSKKTDLSSVEIFSAGDHGLGSVDGMNARFAHSLFNPLLDSVQTNFFARQTQNAVISTSTNPYPTTLFPQISIGPNIAESSDAPKSTNTTYTLAVGQTARGEISFNGDYDYYKIYLVAGQTYTFAEIGTGINSLQNPFLSLINPSGKTVASNDDGGPGKSSLFTYKAPTTGTYYINAGASAGASTGEYGLSVTAGSKASFNIEMGAGALDSYTSWSPIDIAKSVDITYGFRTTLPAGYPAPTNFSPVSLQQIAAVKFIMSLWSDVAQLNFIQLTDVNFNGVNQYSNDATIEIANYSANDGAGAYAYYPGSTAPSSPAGDVWLNLYGGVTTSGVTAGTYPFFAIMHELGHALGLAHPGDYNAGAGGTITYSGSSQFIQDSQMYSVMSYFGGSYTGEGPGGPSTSTFKDTRPGAFATAYTPMLLDIYEIQQIYGANTNTRSTDTKYGFGADAGAEFSYGMSTGVIPQFCIWDGGGIDTLDCSGSSAAQNISLVAGTFSSVNGGKNNVSIALNCAIENAIGGSGNDTIIANSSRNELTGGVGQDIFKYLSAADSNSSFLDLIKDFTVGQDRLDLSVLDANIDNGTTNDTFSFIGGGSFTAPGQVISTYNSVTNVTLVAANIGNDLNADFAVALVGNIKLAANDFVL